MSDTRILEIAIRKLSEAFDEFIGECMDNSYAPKAPSKQAIMRARGFLPPDCEYAFKKKVK